MNKLSELSPKRDDMLSRFQNGKKSSQMPIRS